MRKFLLSSLATCLVLTACAEHSGQAYQSTAQSPQPPVNQPDGGSFDAPTNDADKVEEPDGGGADGGGTGSSGTGSSGTGGSGAGANDGGGSGDGTPDGSTPVAEFDDPGSEGGQGGQPVPEPGTLLLVGTGLAGAALLRRRRQLPKA